MKKIIRRSALLLTVLTMAAFAAEVRAEQFLATFTYREYLTNELGTIVTENDTTASEVVECGEDNALDPKTLVLIYDTVADAVQVVKKSDGSVVCTVFAFFGGTTVTSADGKKQVRQAFLNIPDHGTNAHGSITGRVIRSFDDSGNLTRYTWTARFQASIPEDNEVIEGTLTTSKKFVPTNP